MKHVPKETIQEIADQLGSGFRVFLRRETLEVIWYPNEDKSPSFQPSVWNNEIDAIGREPSKYVEVPGMAPADAFQVMAGFIATIDDPSLKDRLLNSIHQKRPFAHFKDQIDRCGMYRDRWFRFRDQRMIEWVEEQLKP
jgi:Uncharacterised protein family (UPF0158)